MIVYIDGENLVHQLLRVLTGSGRIKNREELAQFDVARLTRGLVGNSECEIRYYTTHLHRVEGDQYDEKLNLKAESLIKWNAHWNNVLRKQGIKIVKAGNLRVREGVACQKCGHQVPYFEEKGVDVRIAIDIVQDAREGLLQAVLSSDSDLIPAVHAAKGCGSRVKNLASKKHRNKGLALACGEWQTYTDEQLVVLFDSMSTKTNGK